MIANINAPRPSRAFENEVEAETRLRRRLATKRVLSSLLFIGVVVWFAGAYRDYAAYVFAPSRPPRVLDNPTNTDPATLAHNELVSISGVTETRGMRQEVIRGVGFARTQHVYFRLRDAPGFIIEAPADGQSLHPASDVIAVGRVVDPARDVRYHALLAAFAQRFPDPRVQRIQAVRIIQVGALPGEGGVPLLVIATLLLAGATYSAYTTVQALQRCRRSVVAAIVRETWVDADDDE